MLLSVGLQLIGVVRALTEIAGLFLIAQGVLYLLAGDRRDTNFVYQLFCIVTRPAISLTRLTIPKAIVDRYIPFVAFLLLFCLWVLLAYVRLIACRSSGLVCN
jgi:hypothetical protein